MQHLALRMKKFLTCMVVPGYRKALRAGVGASIEHSTALDRFNFDCVVDVGANKGQFSTFARVHFPRSRIVSFEPLEKPATVFETIFRDDPKTRLVRAAVAKERGTLTMQITANDDSSSVLKVGKLQTEIFGTVEVDTCAVPAGPLTDFLEDGELSECNLLKIDVQGFELEVLHGAELLLDRFAAIYCELSFAELYAGQALASEVISYLFHQGFHLVGVYNIAFSQPQIPVQADMLFVPK
jgi:FkbM family methyltransferase